MNNLEVKRLALGQLLRAYVKAPQAARPLALQKAHSALSLPVRHFSGIPAPKQQSPLSLKFDFQARREMKSGMGKDFNSITNGTSYQKPD